MADEELLHEKRDSIEISKNAKNETAWKIKLYFNEETQGHIDTVDKLAAIHTALQDEFL